MICIDEGMVKFSGRVKFKIYMPHKPIKKGLKIYILADSESGFVCSLKLHQTSGYKNEDLIMYLTKKYQFANRKLYMDNYYNSFEIVKKMKEVGIYCCGTIRQNRGTPKVFSEIRKSFPKKSFVAYQKDQINIILWHDKKIVSVISSFHNIPNDLKRKQVVVNDKIEMIKSYDKYMGGVDKVDQMLQSYFSEHKNKKWTIKLSIYLINILIYNSYVLYNKFYSGLNKFKQQLTYRTYLISYLTGIKANDLKEYIPSSFKKVVLSHMIDKHPNNKRKNCKYCTNKTQRKTTSFFCSACKVHLCAEICFKGFHERLWGEYYDDALTDSTEFD